MRLGLPAVLPDHNLASRLAWITALRLGFLTLLLIAISFFYLRGELSEYPLSSRVVFVTLGAAFALAALYAAILRTGRYLRQLAVAQILLDQATWTAIVYVSGGATSGATSFYALTCLTAAILIGLRGAVVSALAGVVAYSALCAAFHFRWVLPPHDQPAATYALEREDLVYPLLANTLAITVVALLAGYLAERLRATGGALAEATARAEDAERLAILGRLSAGLAHEVRNPLGSIRGSIEMLRESPALSEDERKLCGIIHRETDRLNDLVSDMMDLSKRRAPRAERVDVATLARDLVELAARSERATDLRVVYDGPPGALFARCDGAQMRQVVWNLLRNAMQVSAAGSEVTVRVAKGKGDRDVVLSVNDCGPGISDADRARIFDAFYTTRTHGTGIGLAVVKRILDEHAPMGASIAVHSKDASGACFEVTLSSDVAGLKASSASIAPPGMR